jgi:hypothetical protein
VNRCFKWAGSVACLAAVLVMLGGHWLALQSFAWGRMIVDYSRQDSLGGAIAKTFDGKHPCPLCLKVRDGWHKDQQRERRIPWTTTNTMPEVLWAWRCVTIPTAPTAARQEQPLVRVLYSEFADSPPTPPPRFLFAAL